MSIIVAILLVLGVSYLGRLIWSFWQIGEMFEQES